MEKEFEEEENKIKIGDVRNRQWLITIHKIDKDNGNEWNLNEHIEEIKTAIYGTNDNIWYIVHKIDTAEEHYHFIAKFKNARKLKQIAKIFGLNEYYYKWIEKVKNLKASLDYLIHKNNPEKEQYKVDQVINLGNTLYTDMTKKELGRVEIFKLLLEEDNAIEVLLENPNIETGEIKSLYYLAKEQRKEINFVKQKEIKRLVKENMELEEQIEFLHKKNIDYSDIIKGLLLGEYKSDQILDLCQKFLLQ